MKKLEINSGMKIYKSLLLLTMLLFISIDGFAVNARTTKSMEVKKRTVNKQTTNFETTNGKGKTKWRKLLSVIEEKKDKKRKRKDLFAKLSFTLPFVGGAVLFLLARMNFLVAAISLSYLFGIGAIVFGIIALNRTKKSRIKSGKKSKGIGLAIMGIILGVSSLIITFILNALLNMSFGGFSVW